MKPWTTSPQCYVHRLSMLHDVLCNWLHDGLHYLRIIHVMKNPKSGLFQLDVARYRGFGFLHFSKILMFCRGCAEMILKFHKAAKTSLLRVTYEKYAKVDCSRVATIKPRDRLPSWNVSPWLSLSSSKMYVNSLLSSCILLFCLYFLISSTFYKPGPSWFLRMIILTAYIALE